MTPSPLLETPYGAPDLLGPDVTGKIIRSDYFKDQWRVLYFYPRDATPGCTTEATDFQQAYEQFQNANAAIVGVSKDTCKSHKAFADKQGLRFLLISDEHGDLCEQLGVWKEKVNYGKKYMGIERSTFLINPKNQIVAQWRKVKVAGHVAEVLQALNACQQQYRIKRPTEALSHAPILQPKFLP